MTTVRSRPNIIQIVADDLGYGDIGCLNSGRTRTPGIDSLIGDGVYLSQHYSASPVCAPARAALLTGRYPHRTGAVDTLDGRGLDRIALDEDTVADALRAAGYATGLIGKWHNGALDPRFHPTRRGFAEFIGFCGGWSDYWDWTIEADGATVTSDGRYLTDVWTHEAIDFVRRHRAEPFFLHLAYNAPHAPLQAPDGTVEKHLERGATPATAAIYAMVEAMDRGIVDLLAELDALGLADDTVVMFTSDNGPQGMKSENFAVRDNCGWRGSKGRVYEGGIRVPAAIRWPAGIPGGRTVADMIHFTDWHATILSLAGAVPLRPDTVRDGVDLTPALRGEAHRAPGRRFWQWNRYIPVISGNAAMRDGDLKLVLPHLEELLIVQDEDLAMDRALRYSPQRFHTIDERPLPPPPDIAPARIVPELYDLADDPWEQRDLAREHPETVRRMRTALEAWFDEVNRSRTDLPNR